MLFRNLASLFLAILGCIKTPTYADTKTSACATSLISIDPKDRTVQLLWWPDSAYRPMSHTALEVNGTVWEPFGHATEEGPVEHHFTAARRRRGILVLQIKVTAKELDDLEKYVRSVKDKLLLRTCSGGVYEALVKVGIMKGSSLPAAVPTPLVAALIFRKILRDDRIGTIRWIGRKSRTKLSPYPLTSLIGPVFEGLAVLSVMRSLESSSPNLTLELMTQGHEAFAFLMGLIQ